MAISSLYSFFSASARLLHDSCSSSSISFHFAASSFAISPTLASGCAAFTSARVSTVKSMYALTGFFGSATEEECDTSSRPRVPHTAGTTKSCIDQVLGTPLPSHPSGCWRSPSLSRTFCRGRLQV